MTFVGHLVEEKILSFGVNLQRVIPEMLLYIFYMVKRYIDHPQIYDTAKHNSHKTPSVKNNAHDAVDLLIRM